MSRRAPPWIVLILNLLLSSVGAAQTTATEPGASGAVQVQGQAAPGTSALTSDASEAPPARDIAGFELLASLGYGRRTTDFFNADLEPYAATFGFETGYTFKGGFRLGGYVDYGMGRTLHQEYTPRFGDSFPLTADAWALSGGLSLGYDLWLHFLVLRYSLSLGVTWLNTDFDGIPRSRPVRDSLLETESTLGFHLAPGLTLFWPLGLFECGLGFDYFVQFADPIPSGIVGKLLVGVKL